MRARSTLISLGLHALLVAGLWQVLQFERVQLMLGTGRRPDVAVERLRYLAVSPEPVALTIPAVATARPASARAPSLPSTPGPTRPLVAPTEVTPGIPPAPSPGVPPIDAKGPATGPLASGRGAVQGIQPAFTEPRLWVAGAPVVAESLVGVAKLDSAVGARFAAYRDSLELNTYRPNKFEKGDWTYTDKNGRKYGIDQRFIRLGKVSIPTALLGFLPLNKMQGNPIAAEREERLAAMRAEILENAQRAMNEEEFSRAVKAIRARKEKERKELEKKRVAETKVISERH